MNKPTESVEIELTQTHNPSVTGRNGTFGINRLRVWSGTGRCFFDPIGKSGKVLNAGMMIEATDMDHLAEVWLQIRGKYPKGK